MSLSPDNARHGRSRSKSRTREKSRTRSVVEAPSPPTVKTAIPKPQYIDAQEPLSPYEVPPTMSMPAMPGFFPEKDITGGEHAYWPSRVTPGLSSIVAGKQEQQSDRKISVHEETPMGDYFDVPPHLPPIAAQQTTYYYHDDPGNWNTHSGSTSAANPVAPQYQYAAAPPQYQAAQSDAARAQFPNYATPPAFQYAVLPEKIQYTTTPYVPRPQAPKHITSYTQSPSNAQQPQYTMNPHPPPPPPPPPPPAPPAPTHGTVRRPPAANAAKPPASPGLRPRTDRLSASGGRPDLQTFSTGMKPPASPLLEPYKGTYQSISPMPSPIIQVYPSDVDDLPPLSPLSSATETLGALTVRPGSKRVKIYDASQDARDIAVALSHKTPDLDPLIDILPALSHSQVMELRDEYKKHCKVSGRGVNIAKHIKLKLGGTALGKIAYVTALGRWESEAYWANFWYQSNSSRRELLIESLMGRSNAEIREIKAAFKDKRYNDSLEKCMDKELKADKFRMAVMMVLEEKRQEERHVYPVEYRNQDVDAVHRALKSKEGGETAILQLVVMMSDSHLREVVRTYERKYGANFPREALRKSNNLVGEILAHILNGAINRPARDALLLHHAITDLSSASRGLDSRHELLISRLVRLHWDRSHLRQVKEAYEDRYAVALERDIDRVVRGDFADFCLATVY